MKIIAHDPSLRNWGIAIIDNNKLVEGVVINTKRKETRYRYQDNIRRALELYKEVTSFVETHYEDEIKQCFEVPHGSQSHSAAVSTSICQALIAVFSHTQEVYLLSEKAIKKSIHGKTKVEKEETIEWAMQEYPGSWRTRKDGSPIKNWCEHVADAVAAGHYMEKHL